MEETLRAQLDSCLVETDFDDLGKKYRGKVRDTYDAGDGRLILITTDRISAFDHIMRRPIPFKGQVLNRLAAFFFENTHDVFPNHVINVPDPNVTVGERCTVVPIEFVVRGYLVGHAWRTYNSGGRTLCGVPLPDGMRENQAFPQPILTPSTKAPEGHDIDISRDEILEQEILDEKTFDYIRDAALALYEKGSVMALERGLILVDTKYEFGMDSKGDFRVVDEVHTPDSSRYFYSDSYSERLKKNLAQRQLSKEFLREWLMDHDFQGKDGQVLPELPDDFRIEVASRYIELFEMVTGRRFDPDTDPDPLTRIRTNLGV